MNLPAASLRNAGMPGLANTVVETEIPRRAVPRTGAGENDRNTDGAGVAAPEIQTLQ